jgi:hypothetical protein
MRRFLPAIVFVSALAIACGGSEFSAGEGDGGNDASVVRDANGSDGTSSSDAAGGEDAVAMDGSGIEDDASGMDGGVHADGGGMHLDAGGADASDAGIVGKDAGVDAGACSGAGQCDSTHPCPSSGGRVVCCASIIVTEKCGSCSSGVCPG